MHKFFASRAGMRPEYPNDRNPPLVDSLTQFGRAAVTMNPMTDLGGGFKVTLFRRAHRTAWFRAVFQRKPYHDRQRLVAGVVLGEPGCVLGERGRRDPPAAEARRGESLFS
jgi:hypothetical protein